MSAAITKLRSETSLKDCVIELEERVDTANARNRPLQGVDRVETSEQLIEALKVAPRPLADVYETLGVKKDSTQAIANYIQKKLTKALSIPE